MMIEQSRVAADTLVVDIALTTDLHGPTDARHAVDAALGVTDESSRQNVLLLVTELASNAVVHGRPPCRLRVRTGAGRLRIEVSDADPRRPEVLHPGPEVDHGRGLLLVAALADDWGVDRARRPAGQDGKVVWAELPYPPPTSPERGVSRPVFGR
ncbi:Histidine kinase-like ATPase domain-containing protein [Prauserella aidingensis]|uniref:ATP-binding protein n=1 Tax=Prauserella aidingensis TaxID=387890 RepID=UPI0020A4CC17|nr:ATP-binding protein [Prauserella aidingensis]MCP2253189.1 Histidine kinase-like ATPase domain-containing protein [Prauserella aidingensis]